MRNKLTRDGRYCCCLLSTALLFVISGASCKHTHSSITQKGEMMIKVTSMEQLRDSVGKLVEIHGILRESKRGTYISAFENIDLAPPPDPSIAKVGSELSVVGILGATQVRPHVARSRDTTIATDNVRAATTEYYITDYKMVPATEKR